MSKQWRIFVVEDDEALHRQAINVLRKDGYNVRGANNKREAVRALWAEEHDVVVCDLKTSTADDIELLQWIRAYRPNVRVILFGVADEAARAFALESGAASYLERPLDLYRLRSELQRLLTQTGFSASLDSFDLLDVIQIISASRKNIALLVNTGLEERGMLCFQEGNLVWAEYGMLRGEEAFFALAAHKNGTVIHQPWNQRVTPNVTQPLSRLILQALTYRAKYARQLSGEQPVISTDHLGQAVMPQISQAASYEVDDTPFLFVLEEASGNGSMSLAGQIGQQEQPVPPLQQIWTESNVVYGVQEMTLQGNVPDPSSQQEQEGMLREWWQQTGKMTAREVMENSTQQSQQSSQQPPFTGTTDTGQQRHTTTARFPRTSIPITPIFENVLSDSSRMRRVPPGMRKTHMRSDDEQDNPTHSHDGKNGQRQAEQKEQVSDDLPSWLTDQPTATRLPAFSPSSSTSAPMPTIAQSPAFQTPPQISRVDSHQMLQVPPTPTVPSAEWQPPNEPEIEQREQVKLQTGPQQGSRRLSSPEWQGSDDSENASLSVQSESLSSVTASRLANSTAIQSGQRESARSDMTGKYSATEATGVSERQHALQRSYNYAALVPALQTLGHSVAGFIAAAVVTLDGQPIAQVVVDEQDIAGLCQRLSYLVRNALQLLQQGNLGEYEDIVLTSDERYTFLRLLRNKGRDEERQPVNEAFQVLITTRNADTTECRGMMANAEDAIVNVLQV